LDQRKNRVNQTKKDDEKERLEEIDSLKGLNSNKFFLLLLC
jgi:hypothetical protein